MSFADVIGFIGVTLVVLAYYFLHVRWLRPKDLSYSVMNFLGSCLILFSLYFHPNFSAALVESMWAAISFLGICRYFRPSVPKVKPMAPQLDD